MSTHPATESPEEEVLPIRLLLRFSGEISTKAAPTRKHFISRMRKNIKEALKRAQIPARFDRSHSRLFIDVGDERALPIVARVFGVQSLSRVEMRRGESLDEILEFGLELFRDQVKGKRFAVRARRVGDRAHLSFTSNDVEKQLGTALFPYAAGVDLKQPEITVGVECYEGQAYFFSERVAGQAGLPVGVEGKALCLISGGFDSPVAAWQMLRRGVSLDYLFCNMGGSVHELDVLGVAKILADDWSYGTRPKLHTVNFEPLMHAIQEHVDRRYWQVVLKRLMVRVADALAEEIRAIALVKGDAVGQVSSQTLQNMAVISRATTLPILRPVVGMNKEEIIEQSKVVGTYERASKVREHCAMVSRGPATAAKLKDIERQEEYLEKSQVSELLTELIATRSIFDLRNLDLHAQTLPELAIQEIPHEAVVIDLRSQAAYKGWHYGEALHLEFNQALTAYKAFDRNQTYVFYCEYEIKSAQLAELLSRLGVRAHHFKGGLKALSHYARERGLPTPDLVIG